MGRFGRSQQPTPTWQAVGSLGSFPVFAAQLTNGCFWTKTPGHNKRGKYGPFCPPLPRPTQDQRLSLVRNPVQNIDDFGRFLGKPPAL